MSEVLEKSLFCPISLEVSPLRPRGRGNEQVSKAKILTLKTAPHPPIFSHTITPTRTLLSQYSALSYNAHQIHLNPEYCREVEGHRDLLVHGPLIFTLMLSVLRSQLRKGQTIAAVEYRNLAPLYVGEPLTVCVRQIPGRAVDGAESERLQWDVWVEDKNGGLSVRATVKGGVSDFPR